MVYLFCLVFDYVCLLLSNRLASRKVLAILTILVLGLFVVLRGRVGSDTGGTYEPMVRNLSDTEGTEPLFLALLYVLRPLAPTPLIAVTVGLGSVLTILLLIYAFRADEDELFMLQAVFIPTQYLGISVSGQRAGLALAVLLLAWQSYARKKIPQALILMVAALFLHYSSALWVLLWWLNVVGIKGKSQRRWVITSTVLAIAIVYFARDYFLVKYLLYFESSYDRPNPWSGVSIIAISLIILFFTMMSKLNRGEMRRLWIVNISAMVLFSIIGLYSYGALRLLGIAEISLIYGVLSLHQKWRLPFSPGMRRSFACIGLVGAILITRYALQERAEPVSSSPVLPYRFIWEENTP